MQYPTYDDVLQARERLRDVSASHWYHEDLGSWQWWFLLLVSIVPWIVWRRYRDRNRSYEILSYGFLWASLATSFDVIGGELLLWGYPDKLLPMVPPMFPADLTVIPVLYMWMYKWASTARKYFIGTLALAFLFSFIIEPVFIFFHMFFLQHWKHIYSFFGFIILSYVVLWIHRKAGGQVSGSFHE
ncbi:CBO0543 family protein [Paenibacillus gansuensis]|uniref:CBO0543 family protein n=1 Tax=Paenibacillus gansuensis TaxID=306542 RepID=A0ABW5PI75_9BACL